MKLKDRIMNILYPKIPEITTTQAVEDTRYTFSELWEYIHHFRFLKDWGFWLIVAISVLVYLFA